MTAAAGPGAGRRLRVALDQVAPALSRASARLWSAEAGGAARYRLWLRTAYQVVRATEPLIADAVAECGRRRDPLSEALAPYLAAHLVDEAGHDRWLLEDYAAAGGDPLRLRTALPGGAVARFAGAPGYWIRHVHPLGLLGHIALLEWYPPPLGAVRALARGTGLPPAAFRTLREHTALDTGHGDRLTAFLDSLDLDGDGHRLLLTAAVTSADGLAEVLAELLAREACAEETPGRNGTAKPTRSAQPLEEPWPTWTASSASASTSAAPPTSSSAS